MVHRVGGGERHPLVPAHPHGGVAAAAPPSSGPTTSMTGSSTTRGSRPGQRRDQLSRLPPGTGHHHRPTRQRPVAVPRQVEGGNRSHDDHRGRAHRHVPQAGERRPHAPSSRCGPPFDDGDGGVVGPAGGAETAGDLGTVGHPHEDHDRPPGLGQRFPVDPARSSRSADMARHHGDRGGQTSVGHRHAGGRRYRHRRGDTRHDLPADSRAPERLNLLAAPPEHEGIATLQPHHRLASPAALHEQGIDLGLAPRPARRRRHSGCDRPARALPRVDPFGPRGGKLQDRRVDQAVVNHDVGDRQELGSPAGQEPGVPRAGAHQVDGHACERVEGPPPCHQAGPAMELPPHSSRSCAASATPSERGSCPQRWARTSTRPSALAIMA